MCGWIVLSFVPRATFSLISNVLDTREKVAMRQKTEQNPSAHGELSAELTGTSNKFCSAEIQA